MADAPPPPPSVSAPAPLPGAPPALSARVTGLKFMQRALAAKAGPGAQAKKDDALEKPPTPLGRGSATRPKRRFIKAGSVPVANTDDGRHEFGKDAGAPAKATADAPTLKKKAARAGDEGRPRKRAKE